VVTIRELALEHATALAEMLNEDVQLRTDLGIHGEYRNTAEGFLRDIGDWCRSRRAVCFAILADGTTVGMISLSRIDPMVGTGRIGYWMGSNYRRRGYCTNAFGLVLQEAFRRGVRTVSAWIEKDNVPSERLWVAAGGTFVAGPADGTLYTLEIELRTRPCV